MIKRFQLLFAAAALALGAISPSPTLAQQQAGEYLHCSIRGQVASLGLYSGYAYFRLKDDPRVFIFFKLSADAVAPRMALVQSAYISGSAICFEGTSVDRNMYLSIPQVYKSFNTAVENVVIPMMRHVTVYPSGSPGPAH